MKAPECLPKDNKQVKEQTSLLLFSKLKGNKWRFPERSWRKEI